MSTWQILRRLWFFANTPRHPLVRYELRRALRWEQYNRQIRHFYRYIWVSGVVIIVIGAVMELFSLTRVSFLMITLTVFIPLFGIVIFSLFLIAVVLWQIPVALAGSTVIVQEKAARTWEMLRLTPLASNDLLLAKLTVGLTRQQTFITAAGFLQVVPLVALLGQVGNQIRTQPGLLGFGIIALTTALFIYERLQEFTLAGLLGLVASLSTENWSVALVGAVALSVTVFLLRTLVVYAAAVVFSGGRVLDVSQVLLVGLPTVVQAPRQLLVGIPVLMIGIAIQESMIRLILWALVRQQGGGS